MQAQAGQLSAFELGDGRLIDASQRLHRALRQSGLTPPFVGFGSHPNQLLGDLRLDWSRPTVHDAHSSGHRLPDTKLLVLWAFVVRCLASNVIADWPSRSDR
jgi:hypothetical protein